MRKQGVTCTEPQVMDEGFRGQMRVGIRGVKGDGMGR
jgi:hypothetical protein